MFNSHFNSFKPNCLTLFFPSFWMNSLSPLPMPFPQTQNSHVPKITWIWQKITDYSTCINMLLPLTELLQENLLLRKVIFNSNILLCIGKFRLPLNVFHGRTEAMTGNCTYTWLIFASSRYRFNSGPVCKRPCFTLSIQRHSSSKEFTSPVRERQPISHYYISVKLKSRVLFQSIVYGM